MAPLLIAALLAWPLAAAASEPSPGQQAAWEARLEQAAKLQAEGKEMQDSIDKTFDEQTKACYKKFQVNSCLKESKLQHSKATHQAQRLINEGKAIERSVKKEQLADKDARQAAEAPQREAELKAREREVSAEQAEKAAQIEQTRADKERKAAEGAKRKAEQAERQRKKVEEHEARLAAKKAQAERRAAEAEAK